MRKEPLLLVLDGPTAASTAKPSTHYSSAPPTPRGSSARKDPAASRSWSRTVLDSPRGHPIVAFDGSRLAEVWTHDEFMPKRARYAELYRIQAGGLSVSTVRRVLNSALVLRSRPDRYRRNAQWLKSGCHPATRCILRSGRLWWTRCGSHTFFHLPGEMWRDTQHSLYQH